MTFVRLYSMFEKQTNRMRRARACVNVYLSYMVRILQKNVLKLLKIDLYNFITIITEVKNLFIHELLKRDNFVEYI